MARKRIDSRQWTGEIGQPAPLPYALHQQRKTPLLSYTEMQLDAAAPCWLFVFSPLAMLAADGLLSLSIADVATAAPDVLGPAAITCLAGLGLCALVHRDIASRVCGWVARAGLVGAVLWSLFHLATGIQDYRTAEARPVQRAQVMQVHRGGGGRSFRRTATTFALADGTNVTIRGGVGGRNCYAVRRVEGTRGFAWLRIVESPAPLRSGELNWPIPRDLCFSNAPLSTVRG